VPHVMDYCSFPSGVGVDQFSIELWEKYAGELPVSKATLPPTTSELAKAG